MKFCSRCGAQNEDDNAVCTSCGVPFGTQSAGNGMQGMGSGNGAYAAPMSMPISNPADHTREMDPQDISENKVVAMLPYLMGWIGIILCALLSANSKYAGFHVREALKLTVCKKLIVLVGVLLCWTVIVPVIAGVAYFILWILGIIGFFNACGGKAVSLPLVRGLGFLK